MCNTCFWKWLKTEKKETIRQWWKNRSTLYGPFDSISQSLLLTKLKAYGCSDKPLSLLQS